MKSYVPSFLRKKMRSFSSSSSSSSSSSGGLLKSLDSPHSKMSLDLSSACVSSASDSHSVSHRALSSKGSWSNGTLQAQKVSSTSSEEIVVLEEITGKVRSQFATKKPPCSSADHELEEAFLRFDANRDGKISALELGAVLRSLGDNPSDEELLLMVKEVDRDGDGFIDLQEFIILNRASASSGTEDLRQAFLVFDADADGKISVEELHHVLSRLGESCTLEECSRMIRGVDMDGDGFVDFHEFCTMMATQ